MEKRFPLVFLIFKKTSKINSFIEPQHTKEEERLLFKKESCRQVIREERHEKEALYYASFHLSIRCIHQ